MPADENFLSRWSRRKIEAGDPARPPAPEPVDVAAAPATAAPSVAPEERPPLPAVESLTPESDFAPFMAPEVDGDLRRQALKTLFSDPRYNVMDMMDVYVDDYSLPDPLPESWLGKLEQLSRLGDRAGRDREEAERSKAMAEGRSPEPGAASVDPTESPALAEALPPSEPEAVTQEPDREIPARSEGDSAA